MFEGLKENIISRIGHARIKSTIDPGGDFRHPDNDNDKYVPLTKETIAAYNKARVRQQKLLCYAPFKNLYFGVDGTATTCCYNRTHAFGTYPEHSIHEMWFGDRAEKLREYIKCNDLSLGCEGCQFLIEVGNYTGTQALYFDHYPLNRNKYPTVMQFELSNVCNLECTMCSGDFSSLIRKNREHLPKKNLVYNEEFTNQLKEFIPHLTDANFYGGEPFLIEQYYEIWDLMAKINPGIKVEIQTNATILNKKVKEVLSKLHCNINISLDSLNPDTYESIRLNAKFEAVQSNIQFFTNYCKEKKTNLTISMCPLRENWEELPAFVNYANKLGANLYFHTVWKPENLAIWNLDSASLSKIFESLNRETFVLKTKQQKKNYRRYADYLSLINEWLQKALTKEKVDPEIKLLEDEKRLKLKTYRGKAQHFAPILKQHGVKQVMLAELRTAITNNKLAVENDMDRVLIKCEKRLEWLAINLPPDINPEKLFEAMLLHRPIEKILMELKQNNKSEMLNTAILFAKKYERMEFSSEDGALSK